LCPCFSALARIKPLTAEFIFAWTVLDISSTPVPPGDIMIGAAAPMTLCGAMENLLGAEA